MRQIFADGACCVPSIAAVEYVHLWANAVRSRKELPEMAEVEQARRWQGDCAMLSVWSGNSVQEAQSKARKTIAKRTLRSRLSVTRQQREGKERNTTKKREERRKRREIRKERDNEKRCDREDIATNRWRHTE